MDMDCSISRICVCSAWISTDLLLLSLLKGVRKLFHRHFSDEEIFLQILQAHLHVHAKWIAVYCLSWQKLHTGSLRRQLQWSLSQENTSLSICLHKLSRSHSGAAISFDHRHSISHTRQIFSHGVRLRSPAATIDTLAHSRHRLVVWWTCRSACDIVTATRSRRDLLKEVLTTKQSALTS